MDQEPSTTNPELKAALARLTPEERSRLSRAIAAGFVAAIEELIAETRAQADILGVSYDEAAIAIRTRAEDERIPFGEAAMTRGREVRQVRGFRTT